MFNLKGYDFNANIHLYSMEDLNILVDVNSGAVHLLDEVASTLVTAIMENDGNMEQARYQCKKLFIEAEVGAAEQELENAVEEGSLFTRQELPALDLGQMPIKALCLNVAHLCNMKCRYCFAQQGDFGAEKGLMSQEVGCRAIDFLIEQSQEIKNLEIDFFGGEPLLNIQVVKQLVEYGRLRGAEAGKNIHFTLTTNAVLLSEDIMDFIIREEISVILSLDGREEVNDRYRVLNNGQGSYAVVLPHIQQMAALNPVSYYVRGTFSRENLDFSQDLEHLIACGFNNVSLEPAVGPFEDYAIGEAVLPAVLREYEQLTRVLWSHYRQGREVNFFHFNLDLNRGPCLAKRLTGCGAGNEYLAVTPTGNIYPCHQLVGQSEFLMGNINEGIVNSGLRERFAQNQLQSKKECRVCWARFFCGGGCPAGAYFTNQDLGKPAAVSCILHRKRVECAIFLNIRKRLFQSENGEKVR